MFRMTSLRKSTHWKSLFNILLQHLLGILSQSDLLKVCFSEIYFMPIYFMPIAEAIYKMQEILALELKFIYFSDQRDKSLPKAAAAAW